MASVLCHMLVYQHFFFQKERKQKKQVENNICTQESDACRKVIQLIGLLYTRVVARFQQNTK